MRNEQKQQGKDIHQGVMKLLTGLIRYIRNPKAYERIAIKTHDAVRKFHFASLLMSEIDIRLICCNYGFEIK